MASHTQIQTLPEISTRIYPIRGYQVMLDRDLAELYGVPTKALNQAVRRNLDRFPGEFAFQPTDEELEILRSQFVTSRSTWGGARYRPWVFTEQWIAFTTSVNSLREAGEA